MTRFRVSSQAQQDIADIAEFIKRDNPVRSLSFSRELRAKIAQATQNPLAYRERRELKAGIRAARHGNYMIFFRFDGETMEVLRVWHGARDSTSLFQD